MPISKQRNKHIQQTLVEAAKLAPQYRHELALVYERERQRGNKNRAALAVARKMVAYMLAVERRKRTSCPPSNLQAPQQRKTCQSMKKHQDHPVSRLPGPADDGLSDGGNSSGSLRFVSGLAENTNSIFCADSSESSDSKWMSGSAESRNHKPRGTTA
jgi:hypothetical protein